MLPTGAQHVLRCGDQEAVVVELGGGLRAYEAAGRWLDGSYRWLQLFTGDVVPAPRTRQGLAVEPMTCPPDALASGEDLLRLEPGQSRRGTWGVRPLRAAGPDARA